MLFGSCAKGPLSCPDREAGCGMFLRQAQWQSETFGADGHERTIPALDQPNLAPVAQVKEGEPLVDEKDEKRPPAILTKPKGEKGAAAVPPSSEFLSQDYVASPPVQARMNTCIHRSHA